MFSEDTDELLALEGVVCDVTERHRAEAEVLATNERLSTALSQLEDAQTHLVQQERLRALGQMASGIAHDLNNALALVVGFSELLRLMPDTLNDRERSLHYLDLILTGAKDAADTVHRLREFYRPPAQVVADDSEPLSVVVLMRHRLGPFHGARHRAAPRWHCRD